MTSDEPARNLNSAITAEVPTDRRGELRERCAELCRKHNSELVRRAYSKLRSWQRAHDAVQEAYVRVFRLDRPPPISFLRAYLQKTVDNVAIDWIREDAIRQRDQHLVVTECTRETSTPEDSCLNDELRECLQRAVNALPPKCRLAYTLVELENRSVREAAAEIGISEMAVYQLVSRAYGHLARTITQRGWCK
jgi:RNA polymerase sigma-70 factor (ECF subfamily)